MNATKIATSKTTLAVAFATGISLFNLNAGTGGTCCTGDDWKDQLISPVGNPIYFEDARITTEARPIFMEHFLPRQFRYAGGQLPLGGDVQVYALQLRAALTERLAFIATKDGYIQFRPNHTLGHSHGWADLAAGFKYALIEKPDDQLLITPGFTVTIPTGTERVFQGHGYGEENLFVSAVKGFDNLHLTGNLGVIIPNSFEKNTAQMHYSVMADYTMCRYFIPFFVFNGYTVLSDGKDQNHQSLNAVPLNSEGYDLINFGSSQARGTTQLTAGCGFRSKIVKHVDFGFAYEAGLSDNDGIFESRLTADLIFRF
jgi:hypothetical protein